MMVIIYEEPIRSPFVIFAPERFSMRKFGLWPPEAVFYNANKMVLVATESLYNFTMIVILVARFLLQSPSILICNTHTSTMCCCYFRPPF
jgi:hypothetical protein